jgi:Fe2+ transport system protein FeoA
MANRTESRRQTTGSGTPVPLLDLKLGTIAVLQDVLDHQSRAVLRSLGLTDGARLRICRLGDPCIIQVRSTRIGLSKKVAQSVYVAVSDGEA